MKKWRSLVNLVNVHIIQKIISDLHLSIYFIPNHEYTVDLIFEFEER